MVGLVGLKGLSNCGKQSVGAVGTSQRNCVYKRKGVGRQKAIIIGIKREE